MTEQPEEIDVPILMPQEMVGGVWSNFARVGHSPYEFTLDFVRIDFAGKQGMVVSRVNLSPLMVMQLIDALQANWQIYTDKAMPKEVRGGEETD